MLLESLNPKKTRPIEIKYGERKTFLLVLIKAKADKINDAK